MKVISGYYVFYGEVVLFFLRGMGHYGILWTVFLVIHGGLRKVALGHIETTGLFLMSGRCTGVLDS